MGIKGYEKFVEIIKIFHQKSNKIGFQCTIFFVYYIDLLFDECRGQSNISPYYGYYFIGVKIFSIPYLDHSYKYEIPHITVFFVLQ